jgi:hypothetical protein
MRKLIRFRIVALVICHNNEISLKHVIQRQSVNEPSIIIQVILWVSKKWN